MGWIERNEATGVLGAKLSKDLDDEKVASLPLITKEAEKGEVPFEPIHFTPVRSPGCYEAQFAKRDDDVVMHFWPPGYAQAKRDEKPLPPFKHGFEIKLKAIMFSEFGKERVVFHNDRDTMGAWYVQVQGLGEKQFYRDLVKTACEKLHYSLGGS